MLPTHQPTATLKSAVEAALFAAGIQDVKVVDAQDAVTGEALDCSSKVSLLATIRATTQRVTLTLSAADCDRVEITLQETADGVSAWVSGGDHHSTPANYVVAVVVGFQYQAQKFNVFPTIVASLMLEDDIYPEEAAEVAAWQFQHKVARAWA